MNFLYAYENQNDSLYDYYRVYYGLCYYTYDDRSH